MTLVYASIEAAEIACIRPEKCPNCGGDNLARECTHASEGVDEMYWVCDDCSFPNRGVLFVYKHSEYPIWSEAQAHAIIERRRELKLSLKDLSPDVGVGVSRLADFERRHDAPMPEQHALLMAALGLIWIAQVHYVDSSVFIGAFSSDVNARAACQQWRDERDDEPLQLAWSDGKTSAGKPMSSSLERDGVTAYVVFMATIDRIDNSDGSSSSRHIEVRE
jgi:hypothetical protein